MGTPSLPTRAQPPRGAKRTQPLTLQEIGKAPKGRGYRKVFFETDVIPKQRANAIQKLGELRRQLALTAASADDAVQVPSQETPTTMTFGAGGGYGSGFYDEKTGNIIRVGRAVVVWGILEELGDAMEPRRSGRHGERYWQPLTLNAIQSHPGYSRASGRALTTNWINGTMIDAYGMDPHGIVPHRLKSADIWFEARGWLLRLSHTAAPFFAIPERTPYHMRKHGHSVPSTPQHRDGFFAGGGVDLDPLLKITGLDEWHDEDYTWKHKVRPQDAHLMHELSVSPYNFFAPSASPLSAQPCIATKCIWRAKLIPQDDDTVLIVDAQSIGGSKIDGWRSPAELVRRGGKVGEAVAAQTVTPREQRDWCGVMRNEVVQVNAMVRAADVDLSRAENALVVMPQAYLLMQHESLPMLPVELSARPQAPHLRPLRVPLPDDVLQGVMEYYHDSLDEQRTQKMFYMNARLKLERSVAHYVECEFFCPLMMLVSMIDFKNAELVEDELLWSCSEDDYSDVEERLMRVYGQRIFRIVRRTSGGPHVSYRLLVPSNRFTCDTRTWNINSQIVTTRLANHIFNENGDAVGGAPLPTRPHCAGPMRFSLARLAWVSVVSSPHDDMNAVARAVRMRDAMSSMMSMDGSELS